MKTPFRVLSALVVGGACTSALPAQTTPAAHHAAPATAAAHKPTCSVLAPISPKIPALPADAPCAKPLYTVTRTPDTHLDYVSPLVSPEVRDTLATARKTFSLDFVDVKAGTGEVAKAGKFLQVKYTGYLANGTKFDSSYDRGSDPISFQYGSHHVIPGWDTGFEGMRVGGKRRLFIPYELAYGEPGRGPIPPKAELIFDVEFVGQGDTAPPPPKPANAPSRLPIPKPGTAPGAAPATTPDANPRPATPPAAAAPAATPPASTTPPPATTPAPKK